MVGMETGEYRGGGVGGGRTSREESVRDGGDSGGVCACMRV